MKIVRRMLGVGLALALPHAGMAVVPQDGDPATVPSLPSLPGPPDYVSLGEVPGCHRNYLDHTNNVLRARAMRDCIDELDGYYNSQLEIYAKNVRRYRTTVRTTWREVNNSNRYTYQQKVDFHQIITARLSDAGENGALNNRYRILLSTYEVRRQNLREALCTLGTC